MTRPRLLAAVVVAAAGLGMLGPAGAAAAAPAMIEPGCTVHDATLFWGFKESFRAYISSDIANGEWTTSRGATYETPEFMWSNGEGRYDPETGDAFVQFLGTVRFTGHDGLLDTTIADPAVSISSEGSFLVLDVSGPSMEGEQIDAQDVEFVELTGVEMSGEGARITLVGDSVLTDAGEVAFPDYAAGTDFDPLKTALKLDNCSVIPFTSEEPPAPPLPVIVGAIAGPLLLVAGIVTAIVLATRRRRARA
jgi:hypothetical protein